MKKIVLIIIGVSVLIIASLNFSSLIKSGILSRDEEEKIELRMDRTSFDQGDIIEVEVVSQKSLFVGFPTFKVYQLIDKEWRYIDIYDTTCVLSCHASEKDICTEQPIVCAPLPEHCQDFDSSIDKLFWDQGIFKTREVECPNLDEARFCSFYEKVESAKYKVVFQYSEDCINEDFFLTENNNVQKIEKEFIIK